MSPSIVLVDEVHLNSRPLTFSLLAIAVVLPLQLAIAQQPIQTAQIDGHDAAAPPSSRRDELAATAIEPVSELTPTTPDADPGALPPRLLRPTRRPQRSAFSPHRGSTYIPVDSWVYPAALRLFSKGYIDSAFLGLRPWTRLSLAHMLERSADKINDSDDDEARSIFQALQEELNPDIDAISNAKHGHAEIESVYTRPLGIAGTPLRDSYHVGQTIINDYGRPYESGFNNITGFSGRAEAHRFSFYFRGEYQHAPSAAGYSIPVAQTLSAVDEVPYGLNQATIPQGPIRLHQRLPHRRGRCRLSSVRQ